MNVLLKYLIGGTTAATLVVGGIAFTGQADLDLAKASALNLKDKVLNLGKDLTTLDGVINTKNTLLDQFDLALKGNVSMATTLRNNITQLLADRINLENQITELKTQVTGEVDSETVATLQAEITKLENELVKANDASALLKTQLAEMVAEVGTTGDNLVDVTKYANDSVVVAGDQSLPTIPTAVGTVVPETPTEPVVVPPTTSAIMATTYNTTNAGAYETYNVQRYLVEANILVIQNTLRTKTGDATLVITKVTANGVGSNPTLDLTCVSTKTLVELQTSIDDLCRNSGNELYNIVNGQNQYGQLQVTPLKLTIQALK